jgi:hypothetical protein
MGALRSFRRRRGSRCNRIVLDRLEFDLRHASGAATVLALQAAGASDLDGCAQRLSDEIPRLAVVEGIPVLGLVLDLEQGGLPANLRACTELWTAA